MIISKKIYDKPERLINAFYNLSTFPSPRTAEEFWSESENIFRKNKMWPIIPYVFPIGFEDYLNEIKYQGDCLDYLLIHGRGGKGNFIVMGCYSKGEKERRLELGYAVHKKTFNSKKINPLVILEGGIKEIWDFENNKKYIIKS